MTTKTRKPYRKRRTIEQERELMIETRDRLNWRLSHQEECFINSVEVEVMELAHLNERLRRMEQEIWFELD